MRFTDPAAAMEYALALSRQGIGRVEPNPAVGAVIVDDELNLLGQGWHQAFGGPHAEVHALQEAGDRAHGQTLFCTLEPCSHHGKTPPCADAVIAAGIRKVVIAHRDPAPHVSGRGIARLKEAGIAVEVGLGGEAARIVLAPFLKFITTGGPWVHAKWAMSLDGKIATRTGHSQWISGPASRRVVHELRGRMDAVIVGVGTVLADDPLLTARPPGPRTPRRVILDALARTPPTAKLFSCPGEGDVWICHTSAAPPERRKALAEPGARLIEVPGGLGGAGVSLPGVLAALGEDKAQHVLVEGGSQVLGAAFDQGLVDECHVFLAPKWIGGQAALSPVGGLGREHVPEIADLTEVQCRLLEQDVLLQGVMRASLDRLPAP